MTKIPVHKFAESLAKTTGLDAELALNFVKTLFELTATELHNTGDPVEIEGLGVFSLTDNPDEPVAFAPAAQIAEFVNAPFAMFEPVEMADGVTDEMLIEPEEEQADEPSDEPVAEPVEEVTEEPAEEPVETPVEAPDEELLPPPYEAPVPEEEKIEEPAEDVAETPAPVEAPLSDDLIIPEDEEEFCDEEYMPTVHKSRFGIGFLCGLFVGLLIGALAIYAYALYFGH